MGPQKLSNSAFPSIYTRTKNHEKTLGRLELRVNNLPFGPHEPDAS